MKRGGVARKVKLMARNLKPRSILSTSGASGNLIKSHNHREQTAQTAITLGRYLLSLCLHYLPSGEGQKRRPLASIFQK